MGGRLSSVSASFVENNAFLKRFLARLFPSLTDIEDVAQEAYLRAYVAEQRSVIENPKAFLFRIARNVALTSLTRKSAQITDYIEEGAAPPDPGAAAAADEEVEARELFGIYCEAVARMPEKCRQVFLFRKVHGLSHKDIAARMSLSVSSVEKYLRQGILLCKAHVSERERPAASETGGENRTQLP